MNPKKIVLASVGCVSFVLGTVGIFLPILPTTPLYLLTAFCFAGSSERLHAWFLSTDLYKKHLDSYVKKEGMTVRTKLGILIPVTVLMTIGFLMMKNVPAGRIILAIVWAGHIIYFGFTVRTIPEKRP